MSFLLFSCAQNPSSDNINKDETPVVIDDEGQKEGEKEDNPSQNPNEEGQGEDQPSEGDPKEQPQELVVDDNTVVTSETWDEDINKVIDYVLGEEHPIVPAYKTLSYEASISVIQGSDSSTSIKVAEIKCFTSILSVAVSNYEKQLKEAGYYLHSEHPYGYRMLSYTTDMCIEYETVQKSDSNPKSYFHLRVYKVDMREPSWYSDSILYYIGAEIPEFEAPSYYYEMDPYTFQFNILCNFVNEGDMESYVNKATKMGYHLVSDTYYDYELESDDKYVTIQIYETSTDYGALGVLLKITNRWPHIPINALLGEDLPKLRSTCSDFSYTYISQASSYCLYFDNSSLDEFLHYKDLLVAAGWTTTTEDPITTYSRDEEGAVIATYHNYYLDKVKDDDTVKSLRLMYYVEGATTALAIFE